LVITIKILPSAGVATDQSLTATKKNLRALIDSIISADYSSPYSAEHRWREKRIDIEFHRPAATGAYEEPLETFYDRLRQELHSQWGKGEVRVVTSHSDDPPASLEQRLLAWTADAKDEAAIMIDDQLEVSPEWWRWVRYAVGAHHCNLGGFEARLFGAVLEKNVNIVATQSVPIPF
jgi:hypothetical protein